ncbi:hypothetical protein E2P81_ATG07438 [Venturia nashicola]|uniref:Uncharacterized protein n=1 Tax=Venturia nashicola TaxID=86259 RepID=A0A4Z1NZ81_9PEZI|nr:hypothetical protein E6O75_ATG07592 [Venturia nashicola]TLD31948.1 hypothetical protein E2P81_ATG07438 [Venturia nashicola]
MAPDQAASLRAQHWREFMEEVLGIPSDTPLAHVLPSVIMKAAKPHYASILTEAAVKARSMATGNQSTQLQASQLTAPQFPAASLSGQGLQGNNTRTFQPYNRREQKYPGPKPAVTPDFIRVKLDCAISNLNLPRHLLDHVRFTGTQGATGSGNFRMDFSDWTFNATGSPGPLPANATNMLEALFRNVFELDAQGVMITSSTVPFMVRVTFRSEYRGRLFDSALKVKNTVSQSQSREPKGLMWRRSASPSNARNETRQISSSNSGAPVSDQYPSRTSFQGFTSTLIDTYRPNGLPPKPIDSYRPSSIPSRADSGNQRLSSSHQADSRQNLEKHPAEALREHGRNRSGREVGRLSPIRDIEMHSPHASTVGFKREREDSPAEEETPMPLRPQVKRPRATDFIDMGDDHYP